MTWAAHSSYVCVMSGGSSTRDLSLNSIAKKVLDRGIDVNNLNEKGQTPIVRWASQRHPKVIHGIRLLKEYAADPSMSRNPCDNCCR